MPDKAWKNRERLVAKFFGGVRNALSGINSKVTHSDVIHDSLFIECKLRAKHTAVKLWDDTKVLADKEKKTPVTKPLTTLPAIPNPPTKHSLIPQLSPL